MNKNIASNNGNGTQTVSTQDIKQPAGPIAVEESQSEISAFDRLTPTEVYLRTSAYNDGYQVAINANDFRPNAETEDKLREKWAKVARESNQGTFDVNVNLHDQHSEREFDRLHAMRDDAEDRVQQAEINLRTKEEALAQLVKPKPESDFAFWLIFAVAIAVFSIGFAPTFHDVFFIGLAQTDDISAWAVSGFVSIWVGAILTLLILVEFGRQITSFNWLGLSAGILVALGFLLIRYSAAGHLDALSVGLTVYEIAIVIGLEATAFFRRKARLETHRQLETHERAENDLASALTQKERSLLDLEKIDQSIKTHIDYVRVRNNGAIFNAAIEEALITAALDGYHAGVRTNHGHKIGRRNSQ